MKLELLEKFAGLALQGIMANPVYFNHTAERIAEDAIKVAKSLVLKLEDTGFNIEKVKECVYRPPADSNYSILTILDGDTLIPSTYNGKRVCYIGNINFIRKRSMSIELDDKTGTLLDISLGNKPQPFEHQGFDLKRIYVIPHFEKDHMWLALDSVEDYKPRAPGQLTIQQAVKLVESGKSGEIIGINEEDIFSKEREGLGDHRAAFAAFAHVFNDQGLTLEEVENQMSSRQIDSISSLVKEYIFAKYP